MLAERNAIWLAGVIKRDSSIHGVARSGLQKNNAAARIGLSSKLLSLLDVLNDTLSRRLGTESDKASGINGRSDRNQDS